MVKQSASERVYRYVRTLLPADHTGLLLLVGFACLFIAPSLGWWPQEHPSIPGLIGEQDGRQMYSAIAKLLLFKSLLSLPIRFAGAAVLFICFWPGRNPERRIYYWVLIPAAAGLLSMVAGHLFLGLEPSSVLTTTRERIADALKATGHLGAGTGLHYTIAGMAAAGLAAFRLRLGNSALPISLEDCAGASGEGTPKEAAVRQDSRFIWILIVVTPAVLTVGQWLTFTTTILTSSSWATIFSAVYWLWRVVLTAAMAVLVAYAIGTGWRGTLSRSLQLPHLQYVGLAVLFPFALAAGMRFGRYLLDRIHWAAYGWGRYAPPSFPWDFRGPAMMLIWPFLPAFIEEIAWRGYLQPRFIGRYGVFRGIALTSVAWGAFHFGSDFSAVLDDVGVLVVLVRRLIMTGVLSFVLAWLTIRSGSVIPAGILHGLYNILLNSYIPSERGWLYLALWAVLGLALFRYWPLQVAAEGTETSPPSTAETGA